jgi:hypothetical protein
MNGTRKNTSLSMLRSLDSGRRAAVKEGNTLATEDSLTRNHNSSSDLGVQKTRRGAKRETSNARGMLDPVPDNRGSPENSLSDLFSVNSGDYLFTSGDKKESATVSTRDSLVKKESFSASQKLGSRRGGKKSDPIPDKTPKRADLERSLSDLLVDDDDDEDDESGRHSSRESLTIVTKDSLQKAKENTNSKANSKRGGRKVTRSYSKEDLSSSLGLRGCPAPPPSLSASLGRLGGAPKDYGRQADDNDTFCGLGTVGEKELARGSPKNNVASPTKTKITMAPTRSKLVNHALPSPFARSSNNDDSDSDDEDLFQGFSGASNNPFRMPAHL